MVLWLVWFAMIGLVFWLGPRPFIGRRRVPRQRLPRPNRTDRSAVVQILFAEREDDILDVDCMVLEPFGVAGRTLPAGFLFSLHLEPPDDDLLATVATDAISDWADTQSIVTLRLVTGDGPPRAKIADERTSLQLDLEGAYG